MKRYVIIAGVNGAGKSTLYHVLGLFDDMKRINVDEIVRDIGNWRNQSDVIKAGKIAVYKLRKIFEEGASFNQETTLCGKAIINNIKKAKEAGYRIELYFVGLDSPELAKMRVRKRVEAGGHGIPDSDIERRYYESIDNLKKIIPICDYIEIYDNSVMLVKIAIYSEGQRVYLAEDTPAWFERSLHL